MATLNKAKIKTVMEKLDNLRADAGIALGELQDELNNVEVAIDGLSDASKEGEKGQTLETIKEALEEATGQLEEMDNAFSEVDNTLKGLVE